MIQPSVVETDADQLEINEGEKQRTILGREAVDAANGAPMNDDDHPLFHHDVIPAGSAVPSPQIDTTSVTIRSGISNPTYNSKSGTSTRTTTTTTTVTKAPTSVMTPLGPTTPTGPVPALSTPAPDVGRATLPTVNPPVPTAPPTQTP